MTILYINLQPLTRVLFYGKISPLIHPARGAGQGNVARRLSLILKLNGVFLFYGYKKRRTSQ